MQPVLKFELPHAGSPCQTADAGTMRELKVVLMDDNAFDRKVIQRISQSSRYNIELIETGSIRETRAILSDISPDIVLLDYRVPDGDGIEFSNEISRSFTGNAPPVIVVTGEGDEAAAVRSMRSGAVDYLPKDGLSVDLFDNALSNALAVGQRPAGVDNSELQALHEELTALRHKTNTNMRLAKAFLMPMAQCAWQWVGSRPGETREGEAARLQKVTYRLAAFLDETLVNAATECQTSEGIEPLDLGEVVPAAISSDPDFRAHVRVAHPQKFPVVLGQRPQMIMLVKELCRVALQSIPAGVTPNIRIDAAADPSGNPILRITDNGTSLNERQRTKGNTSVSRDHNGMVPAAQVLSTSLCHRLAEMNGGEFKLKDLPSGGCAAMIRFPVPSVAHQ